VPAGKATFTIPKSL